MVYRHDGMIGNGHEHHRIMHLLLFCSLSFLSFFALLLSFFLPSESRMCPTLVGHFEFWIGSARPSRRSAMATPLLGQAELVPNSRWSIKVRHIGLSQTNVPTFITSPPPPPITLACNNNNMFTYLCASNDFLSRVLPTKIQTASTHMHFPKTAE